MFLKKFMLVIVVLALSACGYHLRGDFNLPGQLDSLCLISKSPYSELIKDMKATLIGSGVEVVSTKLGSPITLNLLSDTEDKSTSAVSSSEETKQYALSYHVTFILQDQGGKAIYGPTTVSTSRTQVIPANQVMSDSAETDTLYDEMRIEAVNDIMYVLSSNNVKKALDKHFNDNKKL